MPNYLFLFLQFVLNHPELQRKVEKICNPPQGAFDSEYFQNWASCSHINIFKDSKRKHQTLFWWVNSRASMRKFKNTQGLSFNLGYKNDPKLCYTDWLGLKGEKLYWLKASNITLGSFMGLHMFPPRRAKDRNFRIFHDSFPN